MFPKPKRKRQKSSRIVDIEAVKKTRKKYCEICGIASSSIQLANHHIIYKSQGGHDIPENLITLCQGPGSNNCHDDAHKGVHTKEFLYNRKNNPIVWGDDFDC